jgi:hypothetical protein
MPESTLVKPPTVHRYWRTIAIGLTIGIAIHAIFVPGPSPKPSATFTVRGDPLPTPDPRLGRIVDHLDLDQARLADALSKLLDPAGLNCVVAWDALHAGQIMPDTPITLHLKHVTVAGALDAILSVANIKHAPAWNEFDGIVQITDIDTADRAHLFVRFYDVGPLLKRVTPNAVLTESTAADTLNKLITDAVLPTSWKDNGGDIGSISYYPGTLMITHTAQGHHQVEAFLRTLEAKYAAVP